MSGPVVLDNGVLRVTVDPLVGGSITGITHRGLGLSVLGQVPWTPVRAPLPGGAVNEAEWLTRYSGGWPPMFPNAGEAGWHAGAFHGFHGEASVAPWVAEPRPQGLRLGHDFASLPVRMTRDLRLRDDILTLTERAEATGPAPVRVIWGQHVTFGSDLLAGDVAVETGARRVAADPDYDPPANAWRPGATGAWPRLAGKAGPADLSRPRAPLAALAYLTDFAQPFAALRRLDGAGAAVLSWQGGVTDCLWYWCELGGTDDPPWRGQGRLIGLEPCSLAAGCGLAAAAARGLRLVEIAPGRPLTAVTRLQVLRPTGPVTGIDRRGQARMAET